MTLKLSSRTIYIAVSIVAMIVLFYFLGRILIPFLIGLFLAYLGNPLVNRLMRQGLSRTVASLIIVAILIVGLAAILLTIIPIAKAQIGTLLTMMPDIINVAGEKLNEILAYLGVSGRFNPKSVTSVVTGHISQQPDVMAWLWSTTIYSSIALVTITIDIILIPFVAFYFLRDWNVIHANIQKLIPTEKKSRVRIIASECETSFSAFLRGQILVVFSMIVFYTITFTMAGLNVGIILGIFMGMMSFVPYIGSIIGLIIVSIAALAQTGEAQPLVWILLSYAVGHILENFYLSPLLIGQNIGLHPILVIFVILAGGTLFGVWGVILALPFSSVANILLSHMIYGENCKAVGATGGGRPPK